MARVAAVLQDGPLDGKVYSVEYGQEEINNVDSIHDDDENPTGYYVATDQDSRIPNDLADWAVSQGISGAKVYTYVAP